jgi:Rrf2 family protein
LLITRETDYALRVLRALAGGELLAVNAICAQELLPQQFVYKIIKKMEQAGFVRIIRGASGGCRLLADLKTVNLYHLLEIMGKNRDLISCLQPGFQCAWRGQKKTICMVHNQLQQVQESLDAELRRHSLQQILFGGGCGEVL